MTTVDSSARRQDPAAAPPIGPASFLRHTRRLAPSATPRGRDALGRRRERLAKLTARAPMPQVVWDRRARIATLALVAMVVLLPAATDPFWTFVGMNALVIATVALSYVVLVGLAGLPSFAQATLMGIGAFTTFNLERSDIPFPLTLLLAGLVSAVPAVAMAIPGIRLRGVSLGILTLGAAVVGDGRIFTWSWFTGGVLSGASVPPPDLGPFLLDGDTALYGVAACTFGLCYLAVRRIVNGSTGRALLALRSSEPGAVACGLSPDLLVLEAFAIGGFLAGVGGGLFAYALGSLSVVSFNFVVSLNLIVIAVVGGVYSPLGALAAGIVYSFGPALFREFGLDPNLVFVLTGVALVVALLIGRGGIAGAVGTTFRRRERPVILPTGTSPAILRRVERSITGPVLEVRGAVKRFGGITAVNGVDMQIGDGEIVALIGPNGAGKSTLLRLMNGMFPPDEGEVLFDGEPITKDLPHVRARKGMGWCYQSTQLFSDLTVLENVLVPLERHTPVALLRDVAAGRFGRDRGTVDRAYAVLEDAGLAPIAQEMAGSLPFGQLRRLEVARAVVSDPKLLLLDEPATGMNVEETAKFGEFLRSVRERHQLTMLFVEHDMSLVMSLAERVLVLDFGQLIAQGTPDEVRSDPTVVEVYLGA